MPSKKLEFTTEVEDDKPIGRVVPFILDGEEMAAVVPKSAILVGLARRALDEDLEPVEQIEVLDQFLDTCMSPETAERLRERLADPEDRLDYDKIGDIVGALQGEFSGRPPTKRAASSRSRRATGKGSTARARSAG